MNKFQNLFILYLSFFILISCSFDNRTGIWKDKSKELKMQTLGENIKPVFSKVEKLKKETTSDVLVEISEPLNSFEWLQENLSHGNLVPHLEYENKKNLLFKSQKIAKKISSKVSDFEPLILNNNIFFYDNSGSIYNYSLETRDIVWKFNFYKKKFRKIPINISLNIQTDNLIASDNLGYLYTLDLNSGQINWAKNYGVPFRSNIKTLEQYMFAINQDNKFYGIRNVDGEKVLDLETFPSFLQSVQKANISIDKVNKNIYFITSAGEVYSINYETNIINWIYKTTARSSDKTVDLFFSSPIISDANSIIISTSLSTLSINYLTGSVNWEVPFSTYIRPVISKDFIFLISENGFIVCLDKNNGNIIWSKNIFNKSKKINEKNIGKVTSLILASDQIILTTKKGYFLYLNYKNGKIINYARGDKSGFFSKPVIVNKNIYIINAKGQILVFN